MGLSAREVRRAPERADATPVVVRRATGLALGHGDAIVLRGLDLEIARDQTLAIVGANGSGKTTLLRALAGVLAPRAGSLSWPTGAPPNGTGMLLLQDEPVAPFSVRELVALGLGRDGPPSREERARVERLIGDLGIAPLADRSCTQISGGEWQRARLARALISRPSLILFDEPTNHLDPAGRAQILGLCAGLSTDGAGRTPRPPLSLADRGEGNGGRFLAEVSVALVLATHDLDLAARCDRVLLLASGTVLATGKPADVLSPNLLTRALQIPVRRHFLPGDPTPLFRAEASS